MATILIQANAKLNLDLKILGKRSDNYHQIESTFQSIDLSDFLLFRKAKENNFTGEIVCPEAKNIILMAKRLLEREINKKLSCQIHLQKAIPVAAGLGGGSTDAAATLLGLNLLYNLKLSKKELIKIGLGVGADIPFFFYGGTCQVEGIGEKINPIKIKLPKFFVLFRPHKRMGTKMVYELRDKTEKSFLEINRKICPEIKKIEKYLSKFKLKAKLSGSGPTIFSGVHNYKLAKEITEDYKDFNGDIFICQPQNKALIII